MKCTSCGREGIFFGDTCQHCGTRNRDNTQSLDGLWGRAQSKEKPRKAPGPKKSFFRPLWALPFRVLWLPVRLGWWLVKGAF
ncbi:hypothetical protein EJV47_11220 [Hymenobacter gummosus]|uniref:Uncharacterized protein n=1 Tax=Hymenobacter gummosus TaxID=1776032 RepID=A0A3S0HNU2_9BACT|nr:hypothetical protein [Hymenobacter gummosus]RTQ50197.1 hypothetical protein EJV47_11220 [Hymenobacter gummosus]